MLRHTKRYPASSWFLQRQTREKPLRATVCFSIEHARARHVPRDAFDAKFIYQSFFSLEVCRYKRIKIYLTQSADKRTIQFSLYFCYHSAKMTPLFQRKKTLFLHDFHVCRPLIRLSTRMTQKSQQSASKVARPCLL